MRAANSRDRRVFDYQFVTAATGSLHQLGKGLVRG